MRGVDEGVSEKRSDDVSEMRHSKNTTLENTMEIRRVRLLCLGSTGGKLTCTTWPAHRHFYIMGDEGRRVGRKEVIALNAALHQTLLGEADGKKTEG